MTTTDPGRLLLDWIDPFQPHAATSIRERIAVIDDWINFTLDHSGPAAADLLTAKRTYQRALQVAVAVGDDKYRIAAQLLEDMP